MFEMKTEIEISFAFKDKVIYNKENTRRKKNGIY